MSGYRNAVYIPREQCVRIYGWDEIGNRISTDYTYNPHLYIETTGESEIKSIFNTPLRKKIFNTQYERYKYTQSCGNKRLFENIPAVQQFLIERYWKEHETPDFNKFPLKIVFLDIEYYVQGAFSSPDNPVQPINVITLFDSIEKKYITWGTGGDYKPTKPNSTYISCNSEKDMLNRLMYYFEQDYPDVLSGYNSEFFDIPYIINRIIKLFGEEEIKRLSPIGNIYNRQVAGKFGKQLNKWYIDGISCLDYLEVYRTFKQGLQESYKLNDIAEMETGEKKIDYGNIDLGKLADTDWQKFVEYNIQDVYLLTKLEEKLLYLELVRMLAYVGLTPLEHALGTLATVTGAATIEARKQGLIVPTFEKDELHSGQIEGAYVAEPQRGFQDYIVSVDVNSLYPNTMITLNLSPETKIGVIEEQTDEYVKILHVSGKEYKLSPAAFKGFIEKEKIAVSKSKALFSQKKKGIFPIIVDKFYQQRVDIQKEHDKLQRKMVKIGKEHQDYNLIKDQADKLDIKQFTIKILVNRAYGYMANKHAPLGDLDIARSITLTGQAVIKQSGQILTDWINKRGNLTGNNQVKRVVYNDTDSAFFSFKPLVDVCKLELVKDGKTTQLFLDLAAELTTHLNEQIQIWGKQELNSLDCRFEFKRESICDTAIFLQKKRYVLHQLDLKGIPCNKFKYVGVEVVRTTLPKAIKPSVKKLIELMITTKDYTKVNDLLTETYEKYKKLPVETIAKVSGINKLEDYSSRCTEFHTCKRMPIHVKAAYFYNLLLKKKGLANKYETISSGDKIRYFYVVQPNKYRCNTIGFKYFWPNEFNTDFEIDYEFMFQKQIYDILERFYSCVGWRLRKPSETPVTDLFSFLAV